APQKILDGFSFRIVIPAAGERPSYLLGRGPTGVIAQPFDLNTISPRGTATTLVAGAGTLSASETGILATSAVPGRQRAIPTWFDRKGTSLGEIGKAGVIEAIALSPDGRKLAVSEQGGGNGAQPNTIWLHDLASGTRTRATFGATDGTPVWSADGT